MIRGFSIILAFLVAGELLSALTGHFMPGSVMGMILLFLALCFRIVKPDWVRGCAEALTKNMTILFLPSAIGIMDQWGLIKSNLVPWLVIMVIGWALVLAVSGWTHQLIARRRKS